MKGRPSKPTILKKMAGTDQKCRINENEMQVSVLANIPDPPFELSNIAKKEYLIVTNELLAKGMLHLVDLSLVTTYANEMAIYIEMENFLLKNGRVDEFYNEENMLTKRTMKPEVRIANQSLANALKIACQFGLTPSARTKINAPIVNDNTFKL